MVRFESCVYVLTGVLKRLSQLGQAAFSVEGEAECKCENDSGQFSIFGAIEEIRSRGFSRGVADQEEDSELLRMPVIVRGFMSAPRAAENLAEPVA